ncbi:F-box domain-containing protein [Mycena chlorophos]|uniref:F-box domain-containing protein n=1 Tax=Mycena chlorophos TaxID=658473 RepID=A0A8H6TNX6_MYCCL|nr:F-box domain-containing protein [Mycena chlorophos]
MHPILALPSEILSEIFVQCLPPYPICPPLLGDSSPTTLAQVCRSWRETAHATPELWRGIALFTSAGLRRCSELQVATAEVWIKRSGALPLCVILGSTTHGEPEARGVSLLLEHRSRWQYAALRCHVSEWIPGRAPECEMPFLRQLDLMYSDQPREPIEDLGTLDAPHLTTVLLDCDLVLNESSTVLAGLLVWIQLTRVFLCNIDFDSAVGVLHHATNLVACRLEVERWSPPHGGPNLQPGTVFVFPRLETLIITAVLSNYDHLDELLLAIRAPNLRRLHLDHDMLAHRDGEDSLQLAPDSLGCALERLLLSITNIRGPLEFIRNSIPRVGMIEMNSTEDLSSDVWGHWDLGRLWQGNDTV